MTTFQFVKEEFVKKINEIGGVDAEISTKVLKAIELFAAFSRCRGVKFVEDLDEHLLSAYRAFLTNVVDKDDENLLVATAGVVIRTAAENALIPEALSQHWQTLAPNTHVPGLENFICGTISLN